MKNMRFSQLAIISRWHALSGLVALLLILMPGRVQASDQMLVERMQSGGAVLMIRHAEAPGIGDPPGFKLDDCSTQRNLNAQGRTQAAAIGDWLRAHNIERARVYSSQWCRCLDTARLINVGEVRPLPALNNFFTRPQDRESNLAALHAFLAEQPTDGELLVLVTHQVTISALTGQYTPSGHAVLLGLGEGGNYTTIGKLDFEP